MPRRSPLDRLAGLVLAALCGLLPGCADGGADARARELLASQRHRRDLFRDLPGPVIDFAGAPVAPDAPRRIVSLVPSVTELVFSLGLGERLVGRSRWCDWPPAVAALPDLGGQASEDVERLVDLRPDLVVILRGRDDLARSLREDFALRVLQPPTEGVDEIFEGIHQVAEALGVAERGRRLVGRLRDDLEALAREAAERPRVRTLLVLDREPLFVPGDGSFVGDLLRRAGAANVAAGLGATWPTVSLEQVLDWDPELIVDVAVGDAMDDRGLRRAARFWAAQPALAAVAARRVVLLQTGVLTRPGPRMAVAARRLADVIHGR